MAVKTLTVDEVLTHHVGVGRGQWRQLLLIALGQVPVALVLMLMVFTSLDPVVLGRWECTDPRDAFCTQLRQRSPLPTALDEDWCKMDPSRYFWTEPGFSLISAFDLTCGRIWQVAFLNSLYFLMLVVGGLIFARISDKFGRRTALSGGWLLMTITTVLSAIVPNFPSFCVLRTLSAIGLEGAAEANVILSTEQMDPSTRGLAGVLTLTFFIFGEILLAGYAWVFPTWRVLTLVVGLTSAGFMLTLVMVRESPRWMLLHRQYDKALVVLRHLAHWNKRTVDDWVWNALVRTYLEAHNKGIDYQVMERTVVEQHKAGEHVAGQLQQGLLAGHALSSGGGVAKAGSKGGSSDSMSPSPFENPAALPPIPELDSDVEDPDEPIIQQIEVIGPIDAIRRGRLVRRYLVLMSFCLVTLQLMYYGANLAVERFGGSVQFNFLLLALAELPSTLLVALLIDRLGRVILLFLGLLLGSVTSLACAVGGEANVVQVGLAMLTKFASSGAWGVLIVYSAEVLPTSARSTLSGLIAQVGCLGGFLAPYLFFASKQRGFPGLLFVVAAALGKIACSSCSFLPETRGHPQPESLSDMEQLSKHSTIAHLRRLWRKYRSKRKARQAQHTSSSEVQSTP